MHKLNGHFIRKIAGYHYGCKCFAAKNRKIRGPLAANVFICHVQSGQAHSPAVASKQCAMHSCIDKLISTSTAPLPVRDQYPHLNPGSLDHQSAPKWRLDWFSRFCAAYQYVQHRQTNRQTHTQTTLSATSVAIGRIYALCVGDAA